jgi:transcriptional regulator with XRE-family HTH domain
VSAVGVEAMEQMPGRPDVETLGGRIRAARERRGLTQRELAELVGVGARTVRLWEAGRKQPYLARLRTLARVLVVDLGWLLEGAAVRRAEAPAPEVGPTPTGSSSEPSSSTARRRGV